MKKETICDYCRRRIEELRAPKWGMIDEWEKEQIEGAVDELEMLINKVQRGEIHNV